MELKEIQEMLKDHENRIAQMENFLHQKVPKIKKGDESLDDSKKVILELIVDNFFEQPRRFKDIIKQLKVQANFSKNLNYTKILNLLVQEKKLSRKVVNHQWVYFNNG